MSDFYFYTGLSAFLYSLYSGFRYYALTGKGLVTSRKAKEMIKSGEIEMVVDVRTKLEWNYGHYVGAKHIPVSKMNEDKFKSVPKDTGILVYCNTGQRARRAAEIIRTYGFTNVFYIEGPYWTLN